MTQKVLHVVTWNSRCNNAMLSTLLPSLVLGEPEELLKTIDLEISTDDADIIKYDERLPTIFKSITFFPINSHANQHPHTRVNVAEQAFVSRSKGKIMLFLCPDMCSSKGSLSRCLKAIDEGYDMAAVTAIRCKDDKSVPIGVSPSKLTKWSWEHKHPFTDKQTWGNVPCFNHASALFFKCEAGYVARSYHLMPIAILHPGTDIKFNSTIDDDLVSHISPDKAWIAQDSDEVCFIEISPPGKTIPGAEAQVPLTVGSVQAFAGMPYIRTINHFFFNHRIIHRLSEGSTDAEDLKLFPLRKPTPDWRIYREVMDCVGEYMGQTNNCHPGYETYPFPQRLGELSGLLRVHMLRESGDIKRYLELDAELNRIGKQPNKEDSAVRSIIEWLNASMEAVRPPSTASLKDKVVISTLVWGDKYTDKMLNYTWKSMMAKDSLPVLARDKYVIMHIQTTEKYRDIIERADVTWKMKAMGINFQYAIIPDDVISNINGDMITYWMVGAGATLGIHYSKIAKSAFHHSYPDAIYSDKYFSGLLRLSKKHKAIVSPGHRADETIFLPALIPYENEEISIPAGDLMALHLNNIHICAHSHIVNHRKKSWMYPKSHVLIWESENNVQFNCPHVDAAWLSYDTIKDLPFRYFMSIDSELDLICKNDEFYLPQVQDDMYRMEFSEQARFPIRDVWADDNAYAKYMFDVITHRDTLKFFMHTMTVPINRKIRPADIALPEQQINIERNRIFNTLMAMDPYSSIVLKRERWQENRIFN